MTMNTETTSTRHSLYWLPNALTVIRMCLIPLLIAGILSLHFGWNKAFGGAWVLFGIYIFAVATDFFDGFLARRWGVVSDFGRMIDPIADKLLVAGCLIAFMIAAQGAWSVAQSLYNHSAALIDRTP